MRSFEYDELLESGGQDSKSQYSLSRIVGFFFLVMPLAFFAGWGSVNLLTWNSTELGVSNGGDVAAKPVSNPTGKPVVSPVPIDTANLALMNGARANVGVPALTWSADIATGAQAWANKCNFQHGGPGVWSTLGQNIAASWGSPVNAQGWLDEIKYFNPNNRVFSSQVVSTSTSSKYGFGNWQNSGHYSQVVWKGTTQVGCGTKVCNSNSPFGQNPWNFLVCNFSPEGNIEGQSVY